MTDLHINPDLEKELLQAFAPQLSAGCMEYAEQAAAKARDLAPSGSGMFRESIHAEPTRNGARVVSSSPLAHLIEFGAPGHKAWGKADAPLEPQWVFRRAGEATGLPWSKKEGRA